jgi:hypothetical protein
MKKCIYCGQTDQSQFMGVEHLIPQSFGKFGSATPTLDCVCDPCNNFFGRELDQAFARDSWEGITRYKKGLKSRERRSLKRLRLTLTEGEGMGGFGGVILGGVDGTTGQLLPPPPQFHIRNKKTGKFDVFLKDDIKKLKLDEETYGIKNTMELGICGHETEHQGVIDELRKIGINYRERSRSQPSFLQGKKENDKIALPVTITGTIDSVIKRALVKILMNFGAYYIGPNEVLKTEWNKVRNFVRFDTEAPLGRMTTKPFWGEETETMRFRDDSFNLLIENQGHNVVGKLQAYNLYTYDFILVENYNLPSNKEVAMRFTQGKSPAPAKKYIR